MINIEVVDLSVLICFWLAFCRWSALLIQIPILDNVGIPAMVKVLFILLITYAFHPYSKLSILEDINAVGINAFWILTVFNVLVGLVIGFFVKAILTIFTSAGSIITQQIGFGAIRYFDQSTSQQIGPFEKLISLTIVVLILTSGALIPIFQGGLNSFMSIKFVDIGKMKFVIEYFIQLFHSIISSAILLASPLIFTNILIMCVLGIIARIVPQMNVLMVSFVINIGVGLLIFYITSDEFFKVAFRMYTKKLGEWFQFIT